MQTKPVDGPIIRAPPDGGVVIDGAQRGLAANPKAFFFADL